MLNECEKQTELARRELNVNAIGMDRARANIDLQARIGVFGFGLLILVRSAQQHANTSNEFLMSERLGDVIVRTALKTSNLFGLKAACRQDHDGSRRDVPNSLQNLPSIHSRQTNIEDDE